MARVAELVETEKISISRVVYGRRETYVARVIETGELIECYSLLKLLKELTRRENRKILL